MTQQTIIRPKANGKSAPKLRFLETEPQPLSTDREMRPRSTLEAELNLKVMEKLLAESGSEPDLNATDQTSILSYCPIHRDKPLDGERVKTLYYNRESGRFSCKYCRANGDANMLAAKLWKIPVREASKYIKENTENVGIARPSGTGDAAILTLLAGLSRQNLLRDKTAQQYLTDMRLSYRELANHNIGWLWAGTPCNEALETQGITETEISESQWLIPHKKGHTFATAATGMIIPSEDRAETPTWLGFCNRWGTAFKAEMGKDGPGLIKRNRNLNALHYDPEQPAYLTNIPRVYAYCLQTGIPVFLLARPSDNNENCRYIKELSIGNLRTLASNPDLESEWLNLLRNARPASSVRRDPVMQYYQATAPGGNQPPK